MYYIYYCKTLPDVYTDDQCRCRILFYNTLKHHSSISTRVIVTCCLLWLNMVLNVYIDVSVASLKLSIWETFAQFATMTV